VIHPEQTATQTKILLEYIRVGGIRDEMHLSWKSAAILLLLNFSLISHGQGTKTSPASVPYTLTRSLPSALSGNWHLAGVNSRRVGEWRLPFLSFAIEADGNRLDGQGDILAGCQDSPLMRGGTTYFTGKIASDGTFEADNYKSPSKVRLSIHGTVPAPGDSTWQGTYTLKNLSTESDCILDESSAFTATRYASFTGTFSGTITNSQLGTSYAVTFQVTQGEPGSYSEMGVRIPLGAQITVFGLPCSTRGTATKTRTNQIRGDEFFLTFTMDDGALLHLDGNRFLEDSGESTITNVGMLVEGGRCDGAIGSGTFTLR
jgi:hypothetical protein